jgi:hypothetical protein
MIVAYHSKKANLSRKVSFFVFGRGSNRFAPFTGIIVKTNAFCFQKGCFRAAFEFV